MLKQVLTITVNPAIDKTAFIPRFCAGEDFYESSLTQSAGGKGINVSRVLHCLGQPVCACGFLGGTNGLYIREVLTRERIKHDFTSIRGKTRTSLTIIDPLNGAITRALERGPLVTRQEEKLFYAKFKKLLPASKCLVISGRNARGFDDDFYFDLIKIAKKKNVFTLLDASGPALVQGLKAGPDMITPNQQEVEYVMKQKINLEKKIIKKTLRELYGLAAGIVAFTAGSKGAFVYDGRQMLKALPPLLKRKNPVGCGDAFNAGFIFSYLRKKNLADCLGLGVACGSANALSLNPGFIRRCDAREIRQKIIIERLDQ